MDHNKDNGFTLLELLISMTIISIIVVIIFSAFRVGVRAWEKGEQNVHIQQRLRIGLDLVKQQLASVCSRKIMDGGKRPFYLKGDDKTMEFVSLVSMIPGSESGMVFTRYIIKSDYETQTDRLSFYEKKIVLPDKDTRINPDDEDFYEIISGVHDISFEYLNDIFGGEASHWLQSWNHGVKFPMAVRITIKKDKAAAPVYIIARIEQGESR